MAELFVNVGLLYVNVWDTQWNIFKKINTQITDWPSGGWTEKKQEFVHDLVACHWQHSIV